ncbi:ATP-grasp domain-containing protein [Fusibacter paucivorans]|uniref:ATP-grasp domain-containing protein n=1 Tax=Fusibacter paucivorans TaxID=76009 RepID=A0ABS5PKL7_9FIRM|nr:ATP-grasp domain-containing protein [Fusibacter paucivorans]MBS7525566.1 ATP-grasp domain-containing protein [Fusibacter paucivorans]
MQSKVLMVGAGSCQISGIRALKKRGCQVLVADYSEMSKGKQMADLAVLADAFDADAIIKCAREQAVDAVITVGTDQPLLSVVKAAEAMALPRFIDSDVAYNVTNKRAMKTIFKTAGIPTMPFALIDASFEDAELAHIMPPYVVKPVDSQGQRGIFKLNTIAAIRAHFGEVVKHSRETVILVEQYYPNEEVTVSGWVINGEAICLTVTDRVTFHPDLHIGVCTAHEYPSKHIKYYDETFKRLTQQICEAFHILDGPIYFQMLVGEAGVVVNEIACRLGGAYEDITIPAATGVDILSLNIEGVFGSMPKRVDVMPNLTDIQYFSTQLFFCHPGKVTSQTPIEVVEALPYVLSAGYNFDVGETVPPTESASARAGYVIVTGTSEADLVINLKRVFQKMQWQNENGENMVIEGRRNER